MIESPEIKGLSNEIVNSRKELKKWGIFGDYYALAVMLGDTLENKT
jgi:hypothetical protein